MRPLSHYFPFFALLLTISLPAVGGPTVVPTAEGQIGTMPGATDRVQGFRFESIRGQPGELLLGGLTAFGGAVPPPPEFAFITDRIHLDPNPVEVADMAVTFALVLDLPPVSTRARKAAGNGDFVAFGFASKGTESNTMRIDVNVFNELGQQVSTATLDNIPTAPVPDPSLHDTGITVDNQGRVTVAYTEINPLSGFARVAAQRLDGLTGMPIGGPLPITSDGRAATDIALLDPSGDRLLVPFSNFATIRGQIVDTTGPDPVVLPDFPISTTAATFANLNPAVAADPATGNSIVVWEQVQTEQADPGNIRGRRFDAQGNPIGDDFQVNQTAGGVQTQPAVAFGPGGLSAAVWTSDTIEPGNQLDSFLQVYDADGNPIGGEIRVNTVTDGVQDRPAVRFLPEADSQGRPQVTVVWRDVDLVDGSSPRGTGASYKCFSIDGLTDSQPIFADGFEIGDTTSWSGTVQ